MSTYNRILLMFADNVADLDINSFENKELSELAAPNGIGFRHRPCHFQRMNV